MHYVCQIFRTVPDKLGATHINDLDAEDVERIQTLSLLEFTILCDIYRLQCFKRKQRKKRRKEGGVHISYNNFHLAFYMYF